VTLRGKSSDRSDSLSGRSTGCVLRRTSWSGDCRLRGMFTEKRCCNWLASEMRWLLTVRTGLLGSLLSLHVNWDLEDAAFLQSNSDSSVRIMVTWRRVRLTIIAVQKQ
jgi:hypothetical protein